VLSRAGASVHTVEHLLAALCAAGVDQLTIELSGPEVPIVDGSAAPFVSLIEEGGVEEMNEERPVWVVDRPCFWSQGDVHLIALPAAEYRISYTLHYPHSSFLGSQYYSFAVTPEAFKREIAPCRTFCLYEEIAPMIEKGLLRGGGLENALIIKDEGVLNPEGVRFEDEMVRHKILDLIGDLSLVGAPLLAHIVAIRSGHTSNNAFAKELHNHIKTESS
jgi:UDP-3-O-[3-hydroxymyristoyl] N-acetylglucosamine deacetylase